MAIDKTAFISDKRKVEAFKERFLKMSSIVLGRWENEYELVLAMGDSDAASKEKIKVDAMKHIQQLCEEASHEKTLDATVTKLGSSINAIREILEQGIDEARTAGAKDQEISFRIELGIYDGPVKGFLWASLRDLGEDVSNYQEFINRE